MWVAPDTTGTAPGYEQHEVDEVALAGGLVPVASGMPRCAEDAAVRIQSSASALHVARLQPDQAVQLPDAPFLHLFVPRGAVTVEGAGHSAPATRPASPATVASGSRPLLPPRSCSGRCTARWPTDTARALRQRGDPMTGTTVSDAASSWPPPPEDWAATMATFHLWTQVIGKVRMTLTPLTSHWWNVPLYVDARGLTTSLIPHPSGAGFQIDLDLVDHQLVISTTSGQLRRRPLLAEPVADFYRGVMGLLDELGLDTDIWTMPVELPDAIPSSRTPSTPATTASPSTGSGWRWCSRSGSSSCSGAVSSARPARAPVLGGARPGGDPLLGAEAPPHPGGAPNCGPHVMQEAYSREVSSCGYFPGAHGRGVYYSYAYPRATPGSPPPPRCRPRPATTSSWASSCWTTTSSARRRIPTRSCWRSCRARTRLQRTAQAGTGSCSSGDPAPDRPARR
jgi:hypothetical protein